LDEITQLLTEERFKNKLVIILAGYKKDIDDLLTVNPGLRSRFSQTMNFTDFSVEDCWTLVRLKLKKDQKEITEDICKQLNPLMQQFTNVPQFGNGRDIDILVKGLSRYIDSTRDVPTKDDTEDGQIIVTRSEMEYALKDLLSKRILQSKPQLDPILPTQNQQFLTLHEETKKPQLNTTLETKTIPSIPSQQPPDATDPKQDTPRDSDVSDRIWLELLHAKRHQQEEEQKLKKELERLAEEQRKAEEAARKAEQARKEAEERIKKEKDEQKRRELENLERQEKENARIAKQKADDEKKKLELLKAQQQQEAKIQAELRKIGNCPAGYVWIKMGGGYRCGGGSHFVDESRINFI